MKATVVCLCYNHRAYVREAVDSVLAQTHGEIQLIVVDDGSTDGSQEEIAGIVRERPLIKFLDLRTNRGNCTAFNRALPFIEGEFVIDLAADDVLLPGRIALGIQALVNAGLNCAVNFTDAEYISPQGVHLFNHSDKFPHHTIPEGDIYGNLINRYFICSPTMMFRTSVLQSLGGYDETLSYEDFDFWIRSSRTCRYCYTPLITVKKRVLPASLKTRQTSGKHHVESTFRVCEKIFALNKTLNEDEALRRRLQYETRSAARHGQFSLVLKYLSLIKRLNRRDR